MAAMIYTKERLAGDCHQKGVFRMKFRIENRGRMSCPSAYAEVSLMQQDQEDNLLASKGFVFLLVA